jgi:hypothetical protein
MMTHPTRTEQYLTSNSLFDCAQMPIEPEAWYSITMFHHIDRTYEDLGYCVQGTEIETLHQAMDMIKATGTVRCFLWIERIPE